MKRHFKRAHWNTCDATGKICHRTWKQADEARDRTEREGPDTEHEMSIYRCRECGHYHIGHDYLKPREARG